jgi:threonine dehydrogenase-like Zn-dependent dehydrogenase
MRAAVYYGNHQLKIEDVPEPTAGAGQVKVRVSRNGICGTDLHEYFDGPIFIPLLLLVLAHRVRVATRLVGPTDVALGRGPMLRSIL